MCVRLSDIVLYVIACSSVCVCASHDNDMISCVLGILIVFSRSWFQFVSNVHPYLGN